MASVSPVVLNFTFNLVSQMSFECTSVCCPRRQNVWSLQSTYFDSNDILTILVCLSIYLSIPFYNSITAILKGTSVCKERSFILALTRLNLVKSCHCSSENSISIAATCLSTIRLSTEVMTDIQSLKEGSDAVSRLNQGPFTCKVSISSTIRKRRHWSLR